MKYDDASWHYGGEFPEGLPPENGATHIAMFMAWAVARELVGDLHREEFADELAKLRDREITPRSFFLSCCDEQLTDEDLNDEGKSFARDYYTKYLDEYAGLFEGGGLYHAEDSWELFERVEPILDRNFQRWKAQSP